MEVSLLVIMDAMGRMEVALLPILQDQTWSVLMAPGAKMWLEVVVEAEVVMTCIRIGSLNEKLH
jgi:hypothetical protein